MDGCFADNNVGPCDYHDSDSDSFSETSKEDLPTSEGSVSSWETNETACSESTEEPYTEENIKTTNPVSPKRKPTCMTFMTLPPEIRLHIYSWLHRMHPARHAELAPWYPTPRHIKEDVGRGPESDEDDDGDHPRLLSPWRPVSRVPSSLLRVSHQVYYEARLIPFHENEFVFVNWFSSGLWAARAFTKSLAPWQRDAMRYARLEMIMTDLQEVGLKEWESLCELWSDGLWGLRLKISGVSDQHRGIFLWDTALEPEQFFGIDEEPSDREAVAMMGSFLLGLLRLRALRWLEIELDRIHWSKEQKAQWAEELQRRLNAGREGEHVVKVVSVRRVSERKEPPPDCAV